jgi:hypothetical protein
LDVPLIRHDPLSPLVKVIVLVAGIAPQATVISAGAVIVGNAAGLTVMILVCVIVLLHASVNVQLSVTVPPHGPGSTPNVDVTVPLIRHVPLPPFV